MTPEEIKALAGAIAPAIVEKVAPAIMADVEKKVDAKLADVKAASEKAIADTTKAIVESAKGNRTEIPGQASDRAPAFDQYASDCAKSGALGGALNEARTAAKAFGSREVEAQAIKMGRPVIEGTGIMLARAIKAKMVAVLERTDPVSVAKRWGYTDLAKALQQNLFTAGGSLVHEAYASEVIPLLRNKSVVRMAGPRVVPMGATVRWDRQTAAATASYSGENSAISVSEPATDQFELSEKKLTALVPFSNDWLRNASINAEEFVRNDLIRVMALKEDLEFLRGDGTQNKPRGLRFRIADTSAVDHVYTETITTEGAPTLAEARTELGKAKKKLRVANVPMTRLVWFASPNLEMALLKIVGPGGEGENVLAREYFERGTLLGVPVYVSNQVPSNVKDDGTGATGSTASYDRSELYLVDMDEVIIGESMALEIEFFPNATFSNSGTLVSGISNDLSTVRAIAKHDINLAHTSGGVVVSDLSWGQ